MGEEDRMGGNGHEQPEEATHGAAEIDERLEAEVEALKYTLGAWNQKALRLMRDYPGTSLLVAVGAGFLIGRLASRR
jgi:ElaB/YqjD/DUF883 family membrane-anchored ribosome-binding protein